MGNSGTLPAAQFAISLGIANEPDGADGVLKDARGMMAKVKTTGFPQT